MHTESFRYRNMNHELNGSAFIKNKKKEKKKLLK